MWHLVHPVKNCQLENELISTDYTSKVSEKQFSHVWNGLKSRESNVKVHCSWFAGLPSSPYFAAPSLHVQSVPAKLWMPWRQKQSCKLPALLPGAVPILYGSLLTLMTIITKLGVSYVDHMNDDAPEVDSLPEPGTKASCKGCVLHVHADKKHNHMLDCVVAVCSSFYLFEHKSFY